MLTDLAKLLALFAAIIVVLWLLRFTLARVTGYLVPRLVESREVIDGELMAESPLYARVTRSWEGLAWVRDWTWHYESQHRWVASHEYFFLARYPGRSPALPNGDHDHTAEEILALGEFRWWSLDEIVAERPDTSPACLLDVLPALIEGGCPAEPIAIGR